MRQLFSERVFLNMAGQESSQTVRLTLHMQEAVDGAILLDWSQGHKRRGRLAVLTEEGAEQRKQQNEYDRERQNARWRGV